jgi:lipopolysaccharide biosynthesis regulator YciM
MQLPMQYYFFIGAGLVLVAVIAMWVLRRRRKPKVDAGAYVDALKLLVEGHNDSAYVKLQEAVRGGVAPTHAYVKLGELLRNRGEFSKALQIHQSLTVKTDLSRPEKVDLFMNLAADYASMGNHAKAASVLDTAIRNLNLKDPEVHLTLAGHQHALGDREKAYETLREARKLGGIGERELALYMVTAADTLLEKNEKREARRLLQRALKHDADCAPCLYALANLDASEGNFDGAIGRWKRVAALSSELSQPALDKLERILFERGRFGEIEKVYDEVRAARSQDETVAASLADFYEKQGRAEEAIQLLENFLSATPQSLRLSMILTSLYAKHRDADTLRRFLDEASARQPSAGREYDCRRCRFKSATMRWHCPRCNAFDSFSGNHQSEA